MADPPSFTLIGDATGGPPETSTWTRNGVTISDGGSYSISLTVPGVDRFDVFPLDTQIFQQSRYRSTLTVTGNLPEGVVSKNDVPAWERVLHFGTRCLRVPAGCGRRLSFAPQGNKQLREEEEDPPTIPRPSRRGEGKGRDPMECLGHRVSGK